MHYVRPVFVISQSMPFSKRLLLIALCTLGLKTHAEPGLVEEVQVTAERQARSTHETASAVSVVDEDHIKASEPVVIVDLLRGIPGVFVQQTTPGQGIPIIRGLKGSEVLHLVDGVRINNALFRNAPNQYVALVDPAQLEQVEILRGAASTYYGGDAMGGVLNMITRKPEAGAPEQHRLSMSMDSASLLRQMQWQSQWSTPELGILAGISSNTLGDRQAGDERIKGSAYESHAANLALNWQQDEHEWFLNLQHLNQPATARVDEIVTGFGQQEPDSELYLFEPNRRNFFHLRHQGQANLPWADNWSAFIAWQEIIDDRRSIATGSSRERQEANKSRMWSAGLQADKYRGESHISYGLDLTADKIHSSRWQHEIGETENSVLQSRFPDGSTMNSVAAFMHWDHDRDNWRLASGLRYSAYRIDLAAADRGVAALLTPDDLTASASLLYRFSPTLNITANLGRGFRPPNIFDLGTLGERSGNRYNIASDELGPETVITSDFGLKYQQQNLRLELVAWHSDYRDKISSMATGDITEDGRTVVQSRNLNSVELVGLESGFRWLHDDNNFYGSLNWTHGDERDNNGNEQAADRIPPLNGQLGWQRLWHNGIESDVFIRFANKQDRLSNRDIRDPRINPEGTPAWATLNLRLSREFSTSFRARLKLANLSDEQYREHGSGIDAPGRNISISLEALF